MRKLHTDLETTPILAWVWNLYPNYISIDQIEQDWMMLCWAAKWHGEEEVMYAAQWLEKDKSNKAGQKLNKANEFAIVEKLWYLLNEADIVVAHNAEKFDVKKINAKFFEYGLTPPHPYKVVDTLKTSRKCFGLTSHKLDYITQLKGYGHKLKTDFDTWLLAMSGDKETREHMLEYNIHDVVLLEDIYTEMMPWHKGHLIPAGGMTCKCGSTNLKKAGTTRLTAGLYQTYRCRDCGSWLRDSTNLMPKETRTTTLRNIV